MTAVFSSRAWSCSVRLTVDDPRALVDAAKDLSALLVRVDHAASRFRWDSELTRANARAGKPTPVSRLLIDLVTVALDAAAATGGAVDPTVGLAVLRNGYDRDIADVPAIGPAILPLPRPGRWRQVRVHREAGLLTVPVGTALDLGATTKAHVADLAAQTLAQRYGTNVYVEIGGDVAVAGDKPDGWCIKVAEREADPGQLIMVRSGGVATSTTTVRRWTRGGQPMHHIVDPWTGAPADGPWRTVTVAAPDARSANIASTAAIVVGRNAINWLSVRGIAARLVGTDGAVQYTKGWPVPQAVAA